MLSINSIKMNNYEDIWLMYIEGTLSKEELLKILAGWV